MNNNKFITFNQYFFIFSLLSITGFEYFYRIGAYLIVLTTPYVLFVFIIKKCFLSKKFITLFIISIFISILQITLSISSLTNLITPIVLLNSYLIAEIVKDRFIEIYNKTMHPFVILSVAFFLLTYNDSFLYFIHNSISPLFTPIRYNSENVENWLIPHNIIIYNFKNFTSELNRNSGPFWEPGMYAFFLNISLFFVYFGYYKINAKLKYIYIIALLTTFSTTAYIGFLFTLTSNLIIFSKSKYRYLHLLIIIIFSIFIFQFDFIGDKISNQIGESTSNRENRFGAMLTHIEIISNYPILGIGVADFNQIFELYKVESLANGVTLVFLCFGLIFGLIYYYLIFNSCNKLLKTTTTKSTLLFLLLIILSFSQDITIRYFYFFIISIGLTTKINSNHEQYLFHRRILSR